MQNVFEQTSDLVIVTNILNRDTILVIVTSGQSYKASTILIYELRVVNICNLIVITTLEL